MAFGTLEDSIESGQPIDLYEFRFGTFGETFRFTSDQSDFTLTGGEKYTAISISRGTLNSKVSDPDSDKLEVMMPVAETFVQRFLEIAPGEKGTLTLRQMHRADLGGSEDTITIFKGTVRNVSFTENSRVAVLQVLPLTSAYSRPVPRMTYQNLCNHMLYDGRCKINKDSASFKLTSTVTAVSGDTITVTGAAAFNPLTDFFETGFAKVGQDFRTITNQAGDVLTLMVPFQVSPLNQSIVLQAGCKHRLITDCQNKFSNVVNYGGFPHVPTKNIFETGLD